MPKRSRTTPDDPLPQKPPPKGKPKGDYAQRALHVVEQAIGGSLSGTPKPEEPLNPPKDPNAVALGRKGGLKGGRARAAKLTPEERSESARRAAQRRWERTGQ